MVSRSWNSLTLIKLVEERPVLWDKTIPDYRERIERANMWREVFCSLDETYKTASKAEQKQKGEVIVTKWNNIRDAFVRSLKPKNNEGFKRKYVYYNNLKFLLKICGAKESDTSREVTEAVLENETVRREDLSDLSALTQQPKKKPKKSEDSQFQPGTFNLLLEKHDEDELFFASVLSTVKSFSLDDRLEFRIRVMQVVQDIRRRAAANQDLVVQSMLQMSSSHSSQQFESHSHEYCETSSSLEIPFPTPKLEPPESP